MDKTVSARKYREALLGSNLSCTEDYYRDLMALGDETVIKYSTPPQVLQCLANTQWKKACQPTAFNAHASLQYPKLFCENCANSMAWWVVHMLKHVLQWSLCVGEFESGHVPPLSKNKTKPPNNKCPKLIYLNSLFINVS